MTEPKYAVSLRMDVKTYERLKRLANAQQTTMNTVLVKLIGSDEDEKTTRRAQATPTKTRA
jgi:predicted DNA-binding protein